MKPAVRAVLLRSLTTLALIVSVLAAPAFAAQLVKTEDTTLNLDSRIQMLGFAQSVKDPYRNDERVYLFLKQARLGLSGEHRGYRFTLLVGFGNEEEVKAPSPGISLGLLDAFVDVPLPFMGSATYLRIGQFEVPYSRERLTDSGILRFADRSINNLAFRVGRDAGVALHTQARSFVGAVGVFTGGGRDVPERYLPQLLGSPMVILRAGYNNGVDQDVFLASQSREENRGVRTALMANALYLRDSLVGHSSVLNVRLGEKSLLMNGNWNKYLSATPLVRGEVWQGGVDGALRAAVGGGELSAEVEANFGTYSNAYGRVRMAGGRGQVGYAWSAFDLALRYAVVFPDYRFGNSGVAFTGRRPMQEVTPAFTWFLQRRWAKVILDMPVLIGVPVFIERGVGSYVATEQPDQATVLKSGTVVRQNVVEGRMLFQATF